MARLIFLILGLLITVYLIYQFKQLSAEKKKKMLITLSITGLVVFLLVLVISGRLSWLIAAGGAVLTLLPRLMKLTLGLWPTILPYFRRYQKNKLSSMQTRFIKLQINIVSGELNGIVLEGKYKDYKLQLMSQDQLLELLDECKQQDIESAALLMGYLDQKHTGWSAGNDGVYNNTATFSGMDEQEAREILGLDKTAEKAEIIKAHKRIMQKLHPDRGGSDYLAKQINQARDILLKDL